MKNRIAAIVLGACAVAMPALAQSSPLPLPSAVEKDLAARASDVTEVTLGKNMLAFASKFMDGKDGDDAAQNDNHAPNAPADRLLFEDGLAQSCELAVRDGHGTPRHATAGAAAGLLLKADWA